MNRPKIGAVSYLNTKPLVEGMDEIGTAFEVVYDLPSRLADRLADGELEAALIPVVEANQAGYTIVSDACIGCRGPVLSVKLLGKVPPRQIRTLALDEGSRTSCILAQVLLAQRYAVRPATSILNIDSDWRSADTDGVLIIGDRAMQVDHDGFEFCWDLGEQWLQMTGLPFVFAVWAARPGRYLDELDWLLSTSRDTGLESLERIAARYAGQYNMDPVDCLRYLRDNLHFYLSDEEKSGMALFFRYARELNLLDHNSLQFHDCQTT